MAIKKTLKSSIICPVSDHETLLEALQLWGKIEISGHRQLNNEYSQMPLDETVDDLNYIISFLNNYADKESAYKKFKEGLKEISLEKLLKIADSIDILKDYSELRELDSNIKKCKSGISDRLRQIKTLETVKNVKFSAADIKFNNVGSFLGKADDNTLKKIKSYSYLYAEAVDVSDKNIVVLLYPSEKEKEVRNILSKLEVELLDLLDNDVPQKVIARIEKEIENIEQKIQKFIADIKQKYIKKKFNYMVLLDVYENENNLINESQKTEHTKYMSVISGWVPAAARGELQKLVTENFKTSYVHFSKPKKDEDPPVILQNRSFSEPFEVVTNLYGTPSYSWLDPTAYLAPFFILFFGLCLTDAGYGLIITAVTLWFLKSFNLKESTRKFIKMMMWGGVASVVAGALTGSWFG
ncbi:MAG: hypothetical protein PF545_01595, partial [Elusimicrobia bacterium]|nr:hypothetical protein [Elusimicrobiota bacterium]